MLKPNLKLKIFKRNIVARYKLLQKKLLTHNVDTIKHYHKKHLLFCYYGGNKLIAGLYAYQLLGKLNIDLLWVDKSYRYQSLGTKLLKLAEDYAMKNGVLYIRVNSASFQAPKFYLKNGYEQFAKLPLMTTTKKKHYDCYFVKYLK